MHLTYKHGSYQAFRINDPKPRQIHKAIVRDRLLHHAIYRILYPFFDRTFITDSFSCRLNKGTHKSINRFYSFAYKISQNNTRTCWVLKCDIRKFFENIDHEILISILRKYVTDVNIIRLLNQVIGSFNSKPGAGLPLGNLTSRLFVNIYMNELDQFIKHKIMAKFYIRYADDFVVLSNDKNWLEVIIKSVKNFLLARLKLEMHPGKIFTKTLNSGVDFLGWVNFTDHGVLRTSTKRRMIKRLNEGISIGALNSYLGLLGHGNSHKLRLQVLSEAENRKI